MSAVWGMVSFADSIVPDADELMQKPYRDKCKVDDIRTELYQDCYMGCGIQYITKESVNERLPIVDKDNGIIFNTDCILDNRQELMKKLDIEDNAMPDGELAYNAYLKWGIECVKYFRGLFAVAVWDEKNKVFYLANDQVSARCMYYYRNEDRITFSTLIEPILAVHKDIKLNEMYLMDYLAAPALLPTVVVTETPYKGIYKLKPASIITITADKITETTYWTPAEMMNDCSKCKTAEDYGAYFRKLLKACVSDAIRTSGKKGIALSSGLDSSSVGTVAADMLAENEEQLYAYTYVPNDSLRANTKNKIYNEMEDVKAIVAKHPNIIPHFLCNNGKNAMESIPEGLDTLEIPYKAFVNYPNLREIYMKASEEGCRVVLGGQFGNSTISYGNADPIFYDLYDKKRFVELFKCMNNFAKHMNISRKKFLVQYPKYLRALKREDEKPEYSLADPFLSDEFISRYPLNERFELGRMDVFSGMPSTQEIYRYKLCQLAGSTYMGEWDTKLGLKYGIILRDPTRDSRMLSFCYHLPYCFFAHKGTTKWLIRGNMRDMLPEYILDNWDRHGVQNNDWGRRIDRDWAVLKPIFESAVDNHSVREYIDVDKLLATINKPDFSVNETEENLAVYIFTAYVFAQYMQQKTR